MRNTEDSRPYAPAANVIAVLQRVRRMTMPPRMTREFLRGAAISDNIAPRVTAALKFLSLIDDEDVPTSNLTALSTASEEEYHQLLEQIIRTAYSEDFQNIDPTTDSQQQILDTFQKYTPMSQHDRQVMLFLGLCREAGLPIVDSPRERPMQRTKRTTRSRSTKSSTASKAPTTPSAPQDNASYQLSGIAGLLSGITEDDVNALEESNEFDSVWEALGTLAKARARTKSLRAEEQDEEENDSEPNQED